MNDYYGDFDRKAAEWLRELIRAGELPEGAVDERSIRDVQRNDLRPFRRVHLFAGIGGWAHALNLAGWPLGRSVWTGSCPCQPYSSAGKGQGAADPRNLWPEMFRLVRECRPDVIFGEQVEGAIRHGWLDRVSADLEGEGYAVGAAVLGAHSVGAPHIRQRLFWVAHAQRDGRQGAESAAREAAAGGQRPSVNGVARGLADADGGVAGDGELQRGRQHGQQPQDGGPGLLGNSDGTRADFRAAAGGPQRAVGEPGGANLWSRFDVVHCTDGKARRVEPGVRPLAHGVSGRVGMLRGYGNAIVPQDAAEFIRAFLESEGPVT